MSGEPIIHQVLAHYASSCQPNQVETLGQSGGFSGAMFWRLHTDVERLCLRRWPREHPGSSQLTFIHEVLRHVSCAGLLFVPCRCPPRGARQTFVACGGHLWELTPWLQGRADYHDLPSRSKLQAAMKMLAEFHVATISYPVSHTNRPSPGLLDRRDTLKRWQSGDIQRLSASLSTLEDSSWRVIATEIIHHFERAQAVLDRQLERVVNFSVDVQPVIRDVWEQHVLFDGGTVTGLIDFGAMRIDNVSTDIARLLGSLARDNEDDWQAGLDAYQQLRPLSSDEKRLIGTFDLSIVLLSGLNWLRWLYLENRVFPDKEAVFFRLQAILERLRCVTI